MEFLLKGFDLNTFCRKFEAYLAAIVMAIIFIDVLLQILSRILPGQSLAWTGELGEIMMGCLIWFGTSAGIELDKHVAFDIFIKGRSAKLRKYVGILACTLFLAYLVTLGIMTFSLLRFYVEGGQVSTILRIPNYIVRAPILLGCILGSIRLIRKIYLVATGKIEMFKEVDFDELTGGES